MRAPPRYGGIFDYERKALRLNEVNAALENPKVWDEPKRAGVLGLLAYATAMTGRVDDALGLIDE